MRPLAAALKASRDGPKHAPLLLFESPLKFATERMGALQRSALLHSSTLVELLSPEARTSVIGGVPSILVFMLAFIIGVVFIVQLISIAVEDRKAPDSYDIYTRPPPRQHGLHAGPGMSTPSLPQQDRSTMLPPTLPPASFLPSARESFASHSPVTPNIGLPQGNLGPYRSRDSPAASIARPDYQFRGPYSYDGEDPALSRLRQPEPPPPPTSTTVPDAGKPDAICPALILPHGEAQFSIKVESLRKLGAGQYPVEILGPSGRPLLHARLPTTPLSSNSVAAGSQGVWLELSTTPQSRYPHASVGPITLGVVTRQPLEIRGPRGDTYGTMEPSGTGWRAMHKGRMVLFVDTAMQGELAMSAQGPDGRTIATASPTSGQALRVQVKPGVDALLTLLCMLSVVLMSPEQAGLR